MSDGGSREPWIAGPPPPPPSSPPPAGGEGGVTGGPAGGGPSGFGGEPTRPPTTRPGTARQSPLSGGSAMLKTRVRDLKQRSPWVLASAAILLAFAATWLASVLLAFRHDPFETGQERVLQFFSPGSIVWAVAIVVAVGLLAAGRRFDMAATAAGGINDAMPTALLLAACVVSVSSAIDVLVELTNFGHGVDAALAGLLGYLAALPVGLAAAWWAHHMHPPAES